MTDTAPAAPDAGAQTAPQGPQIRILTQFIRDLSFENPRAPDVFRAPGQPEIELGVEMNARGRPDGLFEADLKLTCVARHDKDVTFHLELLYGGLFEIGGVPEDQIELVLMVECPRYLFPFARRIISDITTDGGFPPFQLEPFDFAAIYEARKQGGQGQIQ